jgi:uncharacterized protein (TIGR03382 family)
MTPALSIALLLSLDVAAEAIAVVDGFTHTFPLSDDGRLQPRNLRPLAFGSVPNPPVFTLARGDGSVVAVDGAVVDAAQFGGAPGGIFAVALPELLASEAVTLEAACDGCFNDAVFTFVVGDDVDDVAPAFGDGTGRFTFTGNVGGNGLFGRTGFEVELCVPSLLADEPVMLRVQGEGLTTPHLGSPGDSCTDGSAGLSTAFIIEGGQPRDVCVDVIAIDVAGQESAPITVCGALEASEGGCAASPTPTVAMAGLLLLLRRRRRS